MRKVSKILLIISIIISFIIMPQTTFAKGGGSTTVHNSSTSSSGKGEGSSSDKFTPGEADISKWNFSMEPEAPPKVIDIVGFIIRLMRIGSILLTVLVITILGIKYIIGSVEQKADYKKAYINIIIGVVLVTMVTSIIDVIFSMAQN